MSTCE